MRQILERQPLTLPDMQEFHRALDNAKGFDTDFVKNIAYMTAEIGEALNAFRQFSNVNDEADNQAEANTLHDHVADELADCLAYVVKLANYAEVNLEAAYIAKMNRNISRNWHGLDLNKKD